MVHLCVRCSASSPRLAQSKCSSCGGYVCRDHLVRTPGKKGAVCKGCTAEKNEVGEKKAVLQMSIHHKIAISTGC